MELKQQGEQMKLVAPASFPGEPMYPDRARFALYGLAGGLAFGVFIGLWLEFADKSIKDEGDVWAALELPTMSSMPWAGPAPEPSGWTRSVNGRLHRLLDRQKAAQE